MGHRCGSGCKRKTGERCDTCRCGGPGQTQTIDATQVRRKQATAQQMGLAVDMYFSGMSYRQSADVLEDHFDRPTSPSSVMNWVGQLTDRAGRASERARIPTGDEWVADEMQVTVGGKKYWLFNVMDSKTRVVLAAYLSPNRTSKAATTVMRMARDRSANPPKTVKTDGLRSYQFAVKTALGRDIAHVVSKGIRAKINNNVSERLQGTFRDRDKTLRGMKSKESGQRYIDGLVLDYNYFRPHQGIDGQRPAEAAGASMAYQTWREVAEDSPRKLNSPLPTEETRTSIDSKPTPITVYHATNLEWDATRPGGASQEQEFIYDNPEGSQGFWVATSATEAESFVDTERPWRLLTYQMDIAQAVVDGAKGVDSQEITKQELRDQGITAILDAEGDSHVVHDPSTLTLVSETRTAGDNDDEDWDL